MGFSQLVRFANDAAGLEKILRLLQSLSQILAAHALAPEHAKLCLHLRAQFSLGRRFLRFFRFLECFPKAHASFRGSEGLLALLGVGRWSCLGAYLLLESSTILDAIGLWQTPWAARCMVEANRFWFCALVFSVILGCLQLLKGTTETGKQSVGSGGGESESSKSQVERIGVEDERRRLRRRLVTDCFDLFIPGHVVGWIRTGPVFVGFASVVSTILSSKDVWDRVE